MTIELQGYSERGMINALCNDICQKNGKLRIEQLMSRTRFPTGPLPDFSGIERATLLVEQSFSDFGDLDLLILLDHTGHRKQCVMIEAKVATAKYRQGWNCLQREWNSLKKHLTRESGGGSTSSLFVQLYRKFQLTNLIKQGKSELDRDSISDRYRIGQNPIVLDTVKQMKPYLVEPATFVALVPDSQEAVEEFLKIVVKEGPPEEIDSFWTTCKVGFLSWSHVREISEAWLHTSNAFARNDQQVFGKRPD